MTFEVYPIEAHGLRDPLQSMPPKVWTRTRSRFGRQTDFLSATVIVDRVLTPVMPEQPASATGLTRRTRGANLTGNRRLQVR